MSAALAAAVAGAGAAQVRLMTLDPGHFHAALVQKSMYEQVDPVVHVFAPPGPDLDLHLARIEGFNTRPDDPTKWQTEVHRCDDPLARMLAERPGNVVVISGNNARKSESILRCVEAGLHVLADKPMAITPAGFEDLKQAFAAAGKNGVLLYDIMTERYEITTILQRELSRDAALFGKLVAGSPQQPSVTKESVHHYFKSVAGKPLQRPPWFFDVSKQGEGIVDVTTHLVDLIQWACYPGEVLKPEDVKVLSARTWLTPVTREEFALSTGIQQFPADLKRYVDAGGVLQVPANGEFTYTLRGIHCKVSVRWNFKAPEGAGDTHDSVMRGTLANLVIRQGAKQNYKPTLYVEPAVEGGDVGDALANVIAALQQKWPKVAAKQDGDNWEIVIPDKYKVGHEEHFAQVTKAFLGYLGEGRLPLWETPNMLVKYHTLMEAYRLSR
jgi:predicted dehydrogenase